MHPAQKNSPHSNNPMVWIHGFGETKNIWDPFINQFPNRIHWKVPLLEWLHHRLGCTLIQLAQHFWQEADRQGFQQVELFGNSMGGYLALEIMRENPGRIARCVLISTHPFADGRSRIALRHREKLLILQNRQGALGTQWATAHPEPLRSTILQHWNQWSTVAITGALDALLARRSNAEWILENPTPTHWIVGEADYVPEIQEFMRWKKLQPTLRLTTVPDAQHLMVMENNPLLRAILAR